MINDEDDNCRIYSDRVLRYSMKETFEGSGIFIDERISKNNDTIKEQKVLHDYMDIHKFATAENWNLSGYCKNFDLRKGEGFHLENERRVEYFETFLDRIDNDYNDNNREEDDPYFGCSYDCPTPAFVDGSREYLEDLVCNKLNVASSMLHAFDNHIAICDVKCPFGCTSFLFECGSIDFETVLFRFMNLIINRNCIRHSEKIGHRRKDNLLNGARNDFLSHDGVLLPQKQTFSSNIN